MSLPVKYITGTYGNDSITAPSSSYSYVIRGLDGDDRILASTNADTVSGGLGNDVIMGLGGNDIIYGEGGADLIYGGDGSDVIYGGTGNDRIFGGSAGDKLYGNDGADRFIYTKTSDSFALALPNFYGLDRIVGFQKGVDKIDLSAIDARTSDADNDAFSFSNSIFSSLGFVQLKVDNAGNTWVYGDTNHDTSNWELVIKVEGVTGLTAQDFIL